MKAARGFVSDVAEHISVPEVYVAIRRLLLYSDTAIEEFIEAVESDSMLSVRVMRMTLPNPDDKLVGGMNCLASFGFDTPDPTIRTFYG